MTWPLLAGVAVAGALGAVCRAVLQGIVARRAGGRDGPLRGVAAVNILGALVAGAVAGLAARAALPAEVQLVVATGFLGAFTTFSTWMVQTAVLLEERRLGPALWSLASLLAGVLAAGAGLLATR